MAENTDVLNLNRPEATIPDTSRKPVQEPMINVEVEDRLLRELKRRLFPNDIEGLLLSAITGEIYWQDQLWSLMVDTWPRLQTNLAKLRRAVSSIDYDISPFVAQGADKPTKSALDKASFVKRALFGMHGNPARQERDFTETLEDIIDSWVSGFAVLEIYWEARDGIVPAATRWIPARYWRYPYVLDEVDRLQLNPSGMLGGTQLFDFPPYKFLVCVKTSHANHPALSASMRCLTSWWAASRFGLEWFMTYSQLYGIPQRVAYYQPGDDFSYQKLVAMMRNSGAATWGVYPENTKIEVQAAAGAGGHMPQERLLEQADRVCDILLLGQTLTTDVHESGSRALGHVHKNVWDEIKESVAQYAAKVISTQLVPGIIAYNYGGDVTELPTLRPVIDAPVDLFATAQALKIICSDMRLPVSLRDLYKRTELSQPEPGEELYEPPAPPPPAAAPILYTHPGVTTPDGQGNGNGNGHRLPEGLKPEGVTASASRKVSFALDYSEEPEPGEVLRFVEGAETQKVDWRGFAPKRSAQETIQAQKLESYFEAHAARISGVEWLSIVDDRTTPECKQLNGKKWTYPDLQPDGHDIPYPGWPPIWYNCRSIVLPVIKD